MFAVSDGILNREIDADAADRRHCVRRVADAEQAGTMPALEPVDAHVEHRYLRPIIQLADSVGSTGTVFRNASLKRADSRGLQLANEPLGMR